MRRGSHARSTSGGSCVAASTRTLKSMIQCDGVVTTLMAEVGAKQRPRRTVAYRWCMPWCGVVWCGVVWCGVVGVPKALLPKDNGRDGLVRGNMQAGRDVCLNTRRVSCVVHLWHRAVTLSSAGLPWLHPAALPNGASDLLAGLMALMGSALG